MNTINNQPENNPIIIPDINPETEKPQTDDRVVYCDHCGMPKNKWIPPGPVLGSGRYVPIPCKCDLERMKKLTDERAFREHEDKKQRLYHQASFPASLKEETFENAEDYQPQAMDYAKKYAENLVNDPAFSDGLCLHGPCGTGKTYIAACIGNYLIDHLKPVYFNSIGQLLTQFSSSHFQPENNISPTIFMNSFLDYRLVILDDFGAEYTNNYNLSLLFQIINFLDLNKIPLVITTNLSSQEIQTPSDENARRIYDRIIGKCMLFKVEGDDIRVKNAVEMIRKEKEKMKEQTQKETQKKTKE